MALGRAKGGIVASLSSERLEVTAENFPSCKAFYDMNHVDGLTLSDVIGSNDVVADENWTVDSTQGFRKTQSDTLQEPNAKYEAPLLRDFMFIGVGDVTQTFGHMILGGGDVFSDPGEPAIAWAPNATHDSAYLDEDNTARTAFSSMPATIPAEGCFCTVVSPVAGTATSYWASRDGTLFETVVNSVTGDISGSWGALGKGWTMYFGNWIEWCGLFMFENGAPADIEQAMRWMAEYDDIRIYPHWRGAI